MLPDRAQLNPSNTDHSGSQIGLEPWSVKVWIRNLSHLFFPAWCVPCGPTLHFSTLTLVVFSGCSMKITRHYEKVSSVRLMENVGGLELFLRY